MIRRSASALRWVAFLICTLDSVSSFGFPRSVVSNEWTALRLNAPEGRPHAFTIGGPGFVLLPLDDRVDIAGWNGTLIRSLGTPIHAVADAGRSGELFAITGSHPKQLSVLSRSAHVWHTDLLSPLPDGESWIVADSYRGAWVATKGEGSKLSQLYHLSSDGVALSVVMRSQVPITAIASAGPSAAVAALDKTIVLIRRTGKVVPLDRVTSPVDGLAVAQDGTIFVSTPAGIFGLRKGTKPSTVAQGIHGPLLYRGNRLYVLWQEQSTVLVLKKKPPTSGVAGQSSSANVHFGRQ